MAAPESAVELARAAADLADAALATDLVGLDVSGPLPLTDVFVIATGRNERHVAAIARDVEDGLLERRGAKTLRREGRTEGRWVLLDFGDLVVHIFHEDERHYYQLERLWKDCPTIDLQLPDRRAEIEATEE